MSTYARQQDRAWKAFASNMAGATPEQQIKSLEVENGRLQARLEMMQGLYKKMQQEVEALRNHHNQPAPAPAAKIYNGRPWVTMQEAAAIVGRSVSSVCRYCQNGDWESVVLSGTRERRAIFTDQPLIPPARKAPAGGVNAHGQHTTYKQDA